MEEFEKVHNQTNIERQDEATQVDDLRTPTCSVATSTDKVEQVCVETLTEVRYNDTALPTNTATSNSSLADAAHDSSTNHLMKTTTTTTMTMTTLTNRMTTGNAIVGLHERPLEPFLEEENTYGNGGCKIVPGGSGSGRKSRKGRASGAPLVCCSTRTSSFSERSSSQELLILDPGALGGSVTSPTLGGSGNGGQSLKSPGDEGAEFINSEFYIDESLPSSAASAERACLRHTLHHQQQHQLQHEIRQMIADCLAGDRGSYDEGTIILLLQVQDDDRTYFFQCSRQRTRMHILFSSECYPFGLRTFIYFVWLMSSFARLVSLFLFNHPFAGAPKDIARISVKDELLFK